MASLPKLPAEYRSFLEEHTGDATYEFDGQDWELATAEELEEETDIDGKDYPYFSQLQGYVAGMAHAFEGDETEDADGSPYPFSRLQGGIAIGEGNGDILYLDPADAYAVWCFHHDGGDVERLADSFAEWIEEAEVLDEDD